MQDHFTKRCNDGRSLSFQYGVASRFGCTDRRELLFFGKTLRNYRRLFINERLDRILFHRMADRLVKRFEVDTSHQRIGSASLSHVMLFSWARKSIQVVENRDKLQTWDSALTERIRLFCSAFQAVIDTAHVQSI